RHCVVQEEREKREEKAEYRTRRRKNGAYTCRLHTSAHKPDLHKRRRSQQNRMCALPASLVRTSNIMPRYVSHPTFSPNVFRRYILLCVHHTKDGHATTNFSRGTAKKNRRKDIPQPPCGMRYATCPHPRMRVSHNRANQEKQQVCGALSPLPSRASSTFKYHSF
ncbi:unnamed protein product, partial [Ectocarpus sp. 4 AP-2014]